MTAGRRPALCCAVAPIAAATAIWSLIAVPPAAAYVCAFGIDSPAEGSVSGTPDVRVTGPFVARHGSGERVVEVTFTQAPGALPPSVVRSGEAVGPADRYDVPLGPLTLNGRYTARVRASHGGDDSLPNCADEVDGTGNRDTERTLDVSFGVSVRASPPRNVRATLDAAARRVTVTWGASGDPDVAGYTITRRVGSGATAAGDVPPGPLSWTDANLPAGPAVVTYSVQTARRGPDPGTIAERSAPVAAPAISVPAAPSGTTPTTKGSPTTKGGAGPSSAGTGASTTTTAFSLGRTLPADTSRAETDPSASAADAGGGPPDGDGDGPLQPLFPFPRPDLGKGTTFVGSGDEAVVGRSDGDGGDGPPELAYVASGLLSAVVAAHVLWLRRQADRDEPVEDEDPEGHLETVPPGTPPGGGRRTVGPEADDVPPAGVASRSGGPRAEDDVSPAPTQQAPRAQDAAAGAASAATGATAGAGGSGRAPSRDADPPPAPVPPRRPQVRILPRLDVRAGSPGVVAEPVERSQAAEPGPAEPGARTAEVAPGSGATTKTRPARGNGPVLVLRPKGTARPPGGSGPA